MVHVHVGTPTDAAPRNRPQPAPLVVSVARVVEALASQRRLGQVKGFARANGSV